MIKQFISYMSGCILLILLAILVFPFFMFLVNVPAADILYGIFIYLVCTSIYIIYRYIRFEKQYQVLNNLSTNISTNVSILPNWQNSMEEKYTEIIYHLYEKIREQLYSVNNIYNEQIEYYTLWVHQIKTPIAAIRLTLENMEDNPSKKIIQQEIFKVEQYVELALQYIKLTTLETDLVINNYNLDSIIKQSVRKYAVLFIHKGLSVDVSNCNHQITTDSKWFSFIIEQLLSNAIKYSNHGFIKIDAIEKNDGILLSITDTGMGIRSEDIHRIFEKGYTGFNGRMDKKASGIGLYLVKKVCTALNHDIHITSKLGIGTIVTIKIKDYNK